MFSEKPGLAINNFVMTGKTFGDNFQIMVTFYIDMCLKNEKQ